MSALCNVLGSTPGPFPGEDTKTTAKTSGRSANLVIMGEYCCFFFASLLAYSQLTSYCRKSIPDATKKTVEELARRVDFYNVVQVIGTPASGKTVLVTKYYQRQGVSVTIIEAWPEK